MVRRGEPLSKGERGQLCWLLICESRSPRRRRGEIPRRRCDDVPRNGPTFSSGTGRSPSEIDADLASSANATPAQRRASGCPLAGFSRRTGGRASGQERSYQDRTSDRPAAHPDKSRYADVASPQVSRTAQPPRPSTSPTIPRARRSPASRRCGSSPRWRDPSREPQQSRYRHPGATLLVGTALPAHSATRPPRFAVLSTATLAIVSA